MPNAAPYNLLEEQKIVDNTIHWDNLKANRWVEISSLSEGNLPLGNKFDTSLGAPFTEKSCIGHCYSMFLFSFFFLKIFRRTLLVLFVRPLI